MADKKSENFDDSLDDSTGAEVLDAEIHAVADSLKSHPTQSAVEGNTWDVAFKIVKRYRPIPWILWRVIHSVLGKPGKVGAAEPIAFDIVRPLMMKAARDVSLIGDAKIESTTQNLDNVINAIGSDVAAAICVLHGVCRRISHSLAERVWRPILDDALMRAQIGYHVGAHCKNFGRGKGMLAGFSARSGLAVLIASGEITQAQRALEGLAAGLDIRHVGVSIYGCDPLQIAAMTLSAAGCSLDAAFGTAAFSNSGKGVFPGTEQHLWLSAFSICENLRMGTPDRIEPVYWSALGFNPAEQGQLREKARTLQRKGPSWQWVIQPQNEM